MVSLVASRLSVMASPSWPVLPSTLMRSWRYFSYSAAVRAKAEAAPRQPAVPEERAEARSTGRTVEDRVSDGLRVVDLEDGLGGDGGLGGHFEVWSGLSAVSAPGCRGWSEHGRSDLTLERGY
jgi:hypothetical protein